MRRAVWGMSFALASALKFVFTLALGVDPDPTGAAITATIGALGFLVFLVSRPGSGGGRRDADE